MPFLVTPLGKALILGLRIYSIFYDVQKTRACIVDFDFKNGEYPDVGGDLVCFRCFGFTRSSKCGGSYPKADCKADCKAECKADFKAATFSAIKQTDEQTNKSPYLQVIISAKFSKGFHFVLISSRFINSVFDHSADRRASPPKYLR